MSPDDIYINPKLPVLIREAAALVRVNITSDREDYISLRAAALPVILWTLLDNNSR